MIIGSTLFRMGGAAAYSPAFPRGGESATFSIEVLDVVDAPNLLVTVQHRNEEDTAWTDAGSFSAIGTTGVSTKDLSELKEVIRFKFTFTSTDPTDGVRLIVPAPAWRPY